MPPRCSSPASLRDWPVRSAESAACSNTACCVQSAPKRQVTCCSPRVWRHAGSRLIHRWKSASAGWTRHGMVDLPRRARGLARLAKHREMPRSSATPGATAIGVAALATAFPGGREEPYPELRAACRDIRSAPAVIIFCLLDARQRRGCGPARAGRAAHAVAGAAGARADQSSPLARAWIRSHCSGCACPLSSNCRAMFASSCGTWFSTSSGSMGASICARW